MDPGFFWSWERFTDRWINYFGYAQEDLVITHVDVMENYEKLVCSNLRKSWMRDSQFIKVGLSAGLATIMCTWRTILYELFGVSYMINIVSFILLE